MSAQKPFVVRPRIKYKRARKTQIVLAKKLTEVEKCNKTAVSERQHSLPIEDEMAAWQNDGCVR